MNYFRLILLAFSIALRFFVNNWSRFLAIAFLGACSKQTDNIPDEIRVSLEKAGSNREELLKVLQFYSKNEKDSLKFKSAIFLIKNLENWFYYEDKVLDQYNQYSKLVRSNEKNGAQISRMLDSTYGPFYYEFLDKKYDLENVKSDSLIENIELAFKAWNDAPWANSISFEVFCEYILPYRIKDEKPEFLRRHFYDKYKGVLDSVDVHHSVDACHKVFEVVERVNKRLLQEQNWLPDSRMRFLPHFPLSNILENRVGGCREMCDIGAHVMRALGVPVSIDIVLQWPDAQSGHSWNRVLVPSENKITYLGAREGPDTVIRRPLMGKVFRHTFSPNPQSLAMLKDKRDEIPAHFDNPRIVDVTKEYADCFDIEFETSSANKDKFVYLSVFDNVKWFPVNWAKIKKRKAIFKDNQGGVVYLPSFYNRFSGVTPASFPIILEEDGAVRSLKPDTRELHAEMKIRRVFPMYLAFYKTKRMIGSAFQGANRPDFRDAVNIYNIVAEPLAGWNKISNNSNKKYRYIRYVGPPGQYTAIGEMKVETNIDEIEGTPIGGPGAKKNQTDNILEYAFDNDLRTFYESQSTNESWVGLDLGQPAIVNSIHFSPMYNGEKWTHIENGYVYDLLYWSDNNGWALAGTAIGSNNEVIFENVPSNALYILKSKSRQVRERIFTYEDNKVIWR